MWWQYQGPQQESRADHSLDAWTASYPREVLRGERPKRFFPRFLIGEKSGPAERPRRGRRVAPETLEEVNPSDPAYAGPPPFTQGRHSHKK